MAYGRPRAVHPGVPPRRPGQGPGRGGATGHGGAPVAVPFDPAVVSVESGLVDVVTFQRRRQARISAQDEKRFFLDTSSEYQWARDAAGLAPKTLDGLIKPVVEVCEFYGTVPWQLSSREIDRYSPGWANGRLRPCVPSSARSTPHLRSSNSATPVRSCDVSGTASSRRSTRSTVLGTAATSGCGSRRRRRRCGTPSAAGAWVCRMPVSTWSPVATT
ncbi:protein of unknown function [Streptomyces murinus]